MNIIFISLPNCQTKVLYLADFMPKNRFYQFGTPVAGNKVVIENYN
jgi:hypothetical protein